MILRIVAAVPLILFLIAVACLADPVLALIGVVLASLLFGVPLLVIGVLLLVNAARKQQSFAPGLKLILGVLMAGCLSGLALVGNHFITEDAVAEAQAYPEQIAPILEEYRRAHGAYPSTLNELPSAPAPPRLLKNGYARSVDGRKYSFSFLRPGVIPDTWYYDSETRGWTFST